MFFKIGDLKSIAIFTVKIHVLEYLFKVAGIPQLRCFSENIGKFLRTAFFIEHLVVVSETS